MSIIQLDDENSKRNEWHQEQYIMICPRDEITMEIMAKGMSNQLSKPRGWINENLTGGLQSCFILGYERDRKYLNFKTNNKVLQIISWKGNCDFLRRNRDSDSGTFSKS
jgi:hypothetical protein